MPLWPHSQPPKPSPKTPERPSRPRIYRRSQEETEAADKRHQQASRGFYIGRPEGWKPEPTDSKPIPTDEDLRADLEMGVLLLEQRNGKPDNALRTKLELPLFEGNFKDIEDMILEKHSSRTKER